ncbi:MAG: alpha-isopropylmalate synthase regulatory domain-containing protein [Casimicrobiaceae bacterium]
MQLRVGAERAVYGVGLDSNIVTATLKAVVSAINRGVALGVIGVVQAAPAAAKVTATV